MKHPLELIAEALNEILDGQARQERLLHLILKKERKMAGELDQLESEVHGFTDVIDGAIALMNGLNQKLAEAIASNDMSRVAAVNAELETKKQALAAAIAANTPAAPAPSEPTSDARGGGDVPQ